MGNAIEWTKEQEELYWKDGFLVIDNVLDAEELAHYRKLSEDRQVTASRSDSDYNSRTVHMIGLTGKHPDFLKLAKHQAILAAIVPLLGPNIQLQHAKLATKPPSKGKGEFPWHQDIAFYPHTNTDLLSVMVMLDDATTLNGCMRMVKGSHKLGHLDHTVNGLFSGACQEAQHWQDETRIVDIRPKAGGISIHHGLTLHGSPANRSDRPRRGIVFSYRADDAYQLAGDIWDDTGLVIAGQRTETVRCETSAYRLPKSRNFPGFPFGHAWNQDGATAKQRDYFGQS